MTKNNLKPALRFKGFTEAWEQRKLLEYFTKYQNTVYLDDNEKYIQVSIRNTGIVEYRDTKRGAYIGRKRQYMVDTKTYPLTLTFTRQTVYEGGIGFVPESLNGAIVTENMPLLAMKNADKNFITAFVRTVHYYTKVIDDNTLIGSAQKALHENLWLNSEVLIPELKEQVKIGNLFSKLDNLITLHQRKYDSLVNIKKSLLQKMFPQKNQNTPEIRFKGFTEAWEQRKLGELGNTFTGLSGKSKNDFGHGQGRYITYMNIFSNPITKKTGTEPIEIDNKQNEVKYGDVFFTTSSETPDEVGMSSVWLENSPNIYLNSFCFGYRLETKINLVYFAYALRSPKFREQMFLLAQGISRYNISKNKAMDIVVDLPNIEQQTKIGKTFLELDNLITLHQRKLEKLKNVKKACLKKMFV